MANQPTKPGAYEIRTVSIALKHDAETIRILARVNALKGGK